jgi:hypothetical protein
MVFIPVRWLEGCVDRVWPTKPIGLRLDLRVTAMLAGTVQFKASGFLNLF